MKINASSILFGAAVTLVTAFGITVMSDAKSFMDRLKKEKTKENETQR